MPSLYEFISNQLGEYLRDLETLVDIDCGTHLKAGVDRVAKYVEQRARDLGADVQVYPSSQVGNSLYLRWRGRGQGRIFIIGHLDTVYPEGTVAQHPFRREGAKIFGPGADDMKAGLLAGLYAAHALAQTHADGFGEIAMFCNSDEEIGSPHSREIYPELARGAEAALVLEAARENGAIVSARKGVGTYQIDVHGKAAHAGVEPEKGASAIVGLSHLIVELNKLNAMREGLTVNAGVIKGGTKANVVPDHATVQVDLRVLRTDDARLFEDKLRELCAAQVVKGTRAEFSGGLTNPPMEKTTRTVKLVEWAKEAGREARVDVFDVATGGGSDGNMLASFGLPVLDGLGPQGGRAHNAAEEFVLLDSIVPRVTILSRLIEIIAARGNELHV